MLRSAVDPPNMRLQVSSFLSGSGFRRAVPVVPSACSLARFLPSAGFRDLDLFLSGWDFGLAVYVGLCGRLLGHLRASQRQ